MQTLEATPKNSLFMFLLARYNRCRLYSTFQNINFSVQGKVGLLELNRPSALNALNSGLVGDIVNALTEAEKNEGISAIVMTGNQKAFAAGADISEMKDKTYPICLKENFLQNWVRIAKFRKPLIAAVNGYALGGGFELALMCDIIYAGDSAKFALPEIKLGTIPGGGGTQRLAKIVGKSNAMELALTGRHINAEEARRLVWGGIVSKIFPKENLVQESMKLANEISEYSQLALLNCKEAINKSMEMGLESGLDYERSLFHSTFALNDRKEGMSAFLEKRAPEFKNE